MASRTLSPAHTVPVATVSTASSVSPTAGAASVSRHVVSPAISNTKTNAREAILAASTTSTAFTGRSRVRLPASSTDSQTLGRTSSRRLVTVSDSSRAARQTSEELPSITSGTFPAATPASLATTSIPICHLPSDCSNNLCVQGLCVSGGSLLSLTSGQTPSNSASVARPLRSKHHATPTACSDPRCTLPADITSLNTGDETGDVSDDSHQRTVSNAATAGIVLALLFVTLALLLIVPKIRQWTRGCFNCNKENNGILLDDGSPDFGNRHASTFVNDKHRATFSAVYPSGASRSYHADTPVTVYRQEDVDLGQVTLSAKEEREGPFSDRHEAPFAAYALPDTHYEGTQDITAYIEHHSASVTSASQPDIVSPPIAQPWLSSGREQTQARETVLPYTVDENHSALVGLKNLATPMMQDKHVLGSPRDAYTTPVMANNGFDSSMLSPNTPITPGSAYSVRTNLLPTSLMPAQGRAPGSRPGLMTSRPSFKRISAALRFA